ncbi:MAG TPA: SUMF1/EgtB/PvdO family nonheme iron enzyme [Stellaceae bacterium]|nr:SUMF1/EgtB/PvdO family nonheme iron enzyme [Stellaceae bacterium]
MDEPSSLKRKMAGIFGAAAAVALVILAGLLAWHFWLRPPQAPAPHPAPVTARPATPPQPAPAAPAPAKPAGPPITIPPAPEPKPAPPPTAIPPPPAASAAPQPAPAAEAPQPPPPTPPKQTASGSGRPKTFRDCLNCPEMAVIPAGRFAMGAPAGENERFQVPATEAGRDEPSHRVTFAKPFALAKIDVTRAEFAAFAGAASYQPQPGCLTPSGATWVPQPQAGWEDPGYPQTADDPAVCLSEQDIDFYLAWLHRQTGKDYRLPSEAEWEYAARGGTTTAFYWGDDDAEACTYENVGDESRREKYGGTAALPCRDGFADTAPGGSFKPNPFGLYDMLGNVFVVTADCWNETYAGAPDDGSAWMSGDCTRHPARKADFGTARASMLRAANRFPEGTLARRNRFGFRVALSLP